jgi:hypothetical protein
VTATVERTRPRRLVIRPGHAWMAHRDLAAIERRELPVVCGGTVRFVHTDGRLKEAQCDACSFTVAATVEAVRAASARLAALERAADFNREAWWQR